VDLPDSPAPTKIDKQEAQEEEISKKFQSKKKKRRKRKRTENQQLDLATQTFPVFHKFSVDIAVSLHLLHGVLGLPTEREDEQNTRKTIMESRKTQTRSFPSLSVAVTSLNKQNG
jgi:hypothetical protein